MKKLYYIYIALLEFLIVSCTMDLSSSGNLTIVLPETDSKADIRATVTSDDIAFYQLSLTSRDFSISTKDYSCDGGIIVLTDIKSVIIPSQSPYMTQRVRYWVLVQRI